MPDAGDARRAARHILAGPRFQSHPGRSFDPLGGFLRAIGRGLAFVFTPVGHALKSAFEAVAGLLGGGPTVAVLLALLAVVVGLLVSLSVRRRARLGALAPSGSGASAGDDPDQLERAALSAEAEGDLEMAVRLRFRAGLARLDRGGLVAGGETRTSAELAATLHSAAFEQLAADLEAIVYAGNGAGPEQVEAARTLWPRVPSEAARR